MQRSFVLAIAKLLSGIGCGEKLQLEMVIVHSRMARLVVSAVINVHFSRELNKSPPAKQ